jgi:2-oxo-4-hydroxy-4-carboxy-5-ureidoimidazoline decarboxylase
MNMFSLTELNNSNQADFVDALGSIFEQTPTIAEITWHHRPFSSIDDLHQKMVAVVQAMNPAQQLALIRAHPSLGSKVRMSPTSVQEQTGVGLDQLSAEEYQYFHRLNESYLARFGFPFIIAVKNHTKSSILAAFEQRLPNTILQEQQQALNEIGEIARMRLLACVLEQSTLSPTSIGN